MKYKFEVTYDADTKEYRVDSSDIKLVHSGSSYLRIIEDEVQIGTIGGFCPGTEEFAAKMLDTCEGEYAHLSFSIKKT
jgi:hypothetical protein